MQYRITDYQCTTIQEGTRAAGHQFDIIVVADDESTLNETARVIKHPVAEGETDYFANNNLSTWQIWYCLDNDTTRFAWADSTNGKGVIYRMIDEFNNDVPYDFKNIQFYRQWDSSKKLWSTISFDNTSVSCYTFSSQGNSSTLEFTDFSLSISNNVYSNVIKEYIFDGKLTLNNNCFFGNNCHSNTFGGHCHSNTFGGHCESNTFENNCHSNTFRKDCESNTFGNYCYSNAFESNCYSNAFGDYCDSNTFGEYCQYNIFRNYCQYNIFGNGCRNNTFRNYCQYNIPGNSCSYNTFGNNCKYIKFSSDSSTSTKYHYYQHNHFGDGCQYILFKGAETASSSTQVQNYNFAQGLQGTSDAYLTVDGVRNRSYETKVARNSAGELKIYCEADLVQ